MEDPGSSVTGAAGSRPGVLTSSTSPAGIATGCSPQLVTHSQPPGRSKVSTSPPLSSSFQVSSSGPSSSRRSRSARRYIDSVEEGSSSCASTETSANHSGCGRCAGPSPKP